jgi:hypothetical protein
VTRDTLRRPRRRELGPILARTNYQDAHQRITSLLTFADPTPPPDPAPVVEASPPDLQPQVRPQSRLADPPPVRGMGERVRDCDA